MIDMDKLTEALPHISRTHLRMGVALWEILHSAYAYETETGERIVAMRPDDLNRSLREYGFRNTSRFDGDDYAQMGLRVVTARYVGGTKAKKFCTVVSLPSPIRP